MSAEDADRAAVDAVLLRAGLKVIPEEYERLVRNYPVIQSQLAALRIAEVRYGEPALIYSARTD
jgi:hypothetical protein